MTETIRNPAWCRALTVPSTALLTQAEQVLTGRYSGWVVMERSQLCIRSRAEMTAKILKLRSYRILTAGCTVPRPWAAQKILAASSKSAPTEPSQFCIPSRVEVTEYKPEGSVGADFEDAAELFVP